jgi:hypothetical protein
MGGIVVQLCRADTEDNLEVLIGAATQYWKKQGFTKVETNFKSDGGGSAGAYSLKDAAQAPKKLAVDIDNDRTAVLIISKP